MLKLIRLEWKKNNIKKYIWKAAVITVILLFFIILMARELESENPIQLHGKSMLAHSIDLFTHLIFIIFTGIMISAFIIDAYKKRTMDLMFSYPISRRKILLSQIAAVWIFSFASLLFCKLSLSVTLTLTRSLTGIAATDILAGSLSFWLNMILSSAAMVSVSYISLLTGTLTRLSKTAIVTSVIIAVLTQGNIGDATLAGSIPFYVLLMILAVLSVCISVCHAETRDLR